MRIQVKNLGAIKQAELNFKKLTIICGSNNTGKTYVTYAIFGFLDFWHKNYSIDIKNEYIDLLLKQGVVSIKLDDFIQRAQEIIDKACKEYSSQLANVYSAKKKLFENSEFNILLEENDVNLSKDVFEQKIRPGSNKSDIFIIRKEENSTELVISLLMQEGDAKIPSYVLKKTIGTAIKLIIFNSLLPEPFIASAERTGAAIFRRELDFARNRIIKQLGKTDNEINPIELLGRARSDYALPVEANVEFTRQLESISKESSFIEEDYKEVLNDFSNIIGGEYQVNRNNELYFIPKSSRVKLTMDESSSAVRSMLDIGFYLRHVAKRGDLLMIDEPELNLHPENQRRVARLFARLLHLDISIFITTHSDYIIKELNNLIMLNSYKKHIKDTAVREGYKEDEILGIDELKVYIADVASIRIDGNSRATRCQTLIEAEISQEQGIEAQSFDKTIDDMNRIQDEILFGGDMCDDDITDTQGINKE
jgi:predicted ATPase